MRTFKDSTGREWTIDVTVGAVKRVRELTQVDLFSIFTQAGSAVFNDPVKLVDVLYALCRDQAEKMAVSDLQFGESLVGDSIEAAADAMVDAVVDFFPERRRDLHRRMVDKSKQITEVTLARAIKAINAIDPNQPLTSKKNATGSRGLSASTRGR